MSESQVKPISKDVVILGGGMVGAATAIGLAQLGLNIAVIEAFEPEPYNDQQETTIRVSAVSVADAKLL